MNALYIVVALFFISCAAAMAWLIATTPFEEGDAQGWPAEPTPARDLTIGRDEFTPTRLDRLRTIQANDPAVARLAERREEQRRASARLRKGW